MPRAWATHSSKLKWKEAARRLGPVADVGVEEADSDDAGDDGEVDRGEDEIDGRRQLDADTQTVLNTSTHTHTHTHTQTQTAHTHTHTHTHTHIHTHTLQTLNKRAQTAA